MKNPLNKRLKRELIKNKGRYIAISVMFIVSISVISAFLIVASQARKCIENNQEECMVEDGMFSSYSKISRELLEKLEEYDNSIYENFYIEEEILKDSTLRIYKNREDINLITIMEGELANEKNEISLERLFAESNALKIGDSINIDDKIYKITALVSVPDYNSLFKKNSDIMSDAEHFGVAFLNEEGFNEIEANKVIYNYSYYFNNRELTEKEKTDLAEGMREILINNNVQVTNFCNAEHNQNISYLLDDMGSDIPMMKTFLFIIIAIMAFVFSVLISSTIEEESAIIGTLRASGYTKYEIIRHYMELPVIVTLISSIIGNVLGYTIMPNQFQELYYSSYSIPKIEIKFNLGVLLLTTVVPICIMLVINFLTLYKKLSLSPLKFLRKDLREKGSKKARKLPDIAFISRFRLRVIIQNFGNYFILFLGLIFATFILMFGLGLKPLINNYVDDLEKSAVSNYRYILKTQCEIEENNDVEKYTVYNLETRFDLADDNVEVTTYGIDGNSKYFKNLIIDEYEEGVYISEGLRKKIGIDKGETVKFIDSLTKKEYYLDIVGVYDYNEGLSMFMNIKSLNKLVGFSDNYFNGYFSNEDLNIDEDYLLTKMTKDDMTKAGKSMLARFEEMIPLFIGVSIIFYLVLMYILTKIVIEKNAISISFMKVFGYDNKEVKKLYLRTTTYVVIGVLLLSLPVAYIALGAVMEIAFVSIRGYIPLYIPYYTMITIFIIGIVSYFSINFIHIRHVNKIKMTDALKDRE